MTSTVTIDQTTHTSTQNPGKQAAVNALAVVGFIALLIIGITLAIYSARYVPIAISKISDITGGSNTPNSLAVVPTNIPFSNNSANNAGILTATTTTALTPPPYDESANTAPATSQTANVSAATGSYTSPAPVVSHPRGPYGLSDLSVSIIATGYLAGESTASFVPASVVPPGARPAVEFSIANKGTNVTGPWNFLAQIPTFNNSVFTSPTEPSLNPGDHTVFTLGFNEAIPGPAQTITVVADPNDTIAESNEGNNSAAAAVTITATGN